MNTRNAFAVWLVLPLLVIPGTNVRRERSWASHQPPVQIDRAVFDGRILDMSVHEVIATVGDSPGDYRTRRERDPLYLCTQLPPEGELGAPLKWYLDDGILTVWFQEGRATGLWWLFSVPEAAFPKEFEWADQWWRCEPAWARAILGDKLKAPSWLSDLPLHEPDQ